MNSFDDGFDAEKKVMDSYRKRGFVTSEQDEADLHQSFSPYKVPRGLTKLQIRRRINKFVRAGRKLDTSFLVANRLEVRINGKFVLGASFGGRIPQNSRQIRQLLRAVAE